jgi:hypothetical protein
MSIFLATSFWNQQAVVVGPAPGPTYSVRTDPYSASIVIAQPYSIFSELGMSAFTQSLDGLIRTGNQANSYNVRATGSAGSAPPGTTGVLFPSASTDTFSGSLWSTQGYTSSLSIKQAQNAGTYVREIGSNNFVVEFFINVQAASFGLPPYHGHIFGENGGDNLTMQYSSTPQFRWYINTVNTWSSGTPNYNLGFSNANWKHVAMVKSGTNVYIYVNGTRIVSGTRAATINSGQPNQQLLGIDRTENDGLSRLIQDYRVYVGTDKGYTGATITVPDSIVVKN